MFRNRYRSGTGRTPVTCSKDGRRTGIGDLQGRQESGEHSGQETDEDRETEYRSVEPDIGDAGDSLRFQYQDQPDRPTS